MRKGPIPWITLLGDWTAVPEESGQSGTTDCSLDDLMIHTMILVLVRIRNQRIYRLGTEVDHQIAANWRYPFARRTLRFHFHLLGTILMALRCRTGYRFEMG